MRTGYSWVGYFLNRDFAGKIDTGNQIAQEKVVGIDYFVIDVKPGCGESIEL